MAEVSYVPDNSGNTVPAWLAMNNGGWGNGLFGGGFGSSFFGALLGSIVPGIFGGWGVNGFGGSNNGAAAASLGAQATANSNAEMILNAINGTDADVRLLATTLNGDVDAIRLGINTIQGAIANVANQVGLSSLQVVNAIQAGNSDLASRLCNCCCEMKTLVSQQGYENQLATLNQTNALANAITSASQRNVDAIADLKTTTISEFCAARERDMQSKIDTQADIITQLRSQIDNANQTAAITGYVNSVVAPLQTKVDAIASKQLPTVPVVYPNLSVVNNTPYTGGYYGMTF